MPNFVGTKDSGRHRGPHQKARAVALRDLPYISACVRCGGPMRKDAKDQHGNSALHYDHNDDNTGYLGFSHAWCNRAVAQAKGGRVAAAKRAGLTRPCATCGQQFVPWAAEQTRCSQACRGHTPSVRTWQCRYCGQIGQQTGGGMTRVRCDSAACHRQYQVEYQRNAQPLSRQVRRGYNQQRERNRQQRHRRASLSPQQLPAW